MTHEKHSGTSFIQTSQKLDVLHFLNSSHASPSSGGNLQKAITNIPYPPIEYLPYSNALGFCLRLQISPGLFLPQFGPPFVSATGGFGITFGFTQMEQVRGKKLTPEKMVPVRVFIL